MFKYSHIHAWWRNAFPKGIEYDRNAPPWEHVTGLWFACERDMCTKTVLRKSRLEVNLHSVNGIFFLTLPNTNVMWIKHDKIILKECNHLSLRYFDTIDGCRTQFKGTFLCVGDDWGKLFFCFYFFSHHSKISFSGGSKKFRIWVGCGRIPGLCGLLLMPFLIHCVY